MATKIRTICTHECGAFLEGRQKFAIDVLTGLSDSKKSIPSQYMYDDEGSRLFNKITQLPSYYPTRCEKDALNKNKDKIGKYVDGAPFNMVEFGPGDGSKAKILIDNFLKKGYDFQYVPIDISEGALDQLINNIKNDFPDLQITALVSEYFQGINWLNDQFEEKNLVLFLGSNIGNFSHSQNRIFLRNLWNCLDNGDNVLLGFDLKKDIETLIKAYNDPEGVTAQFNLNVLKRINRELGGNFDLTKFRHMDTYDVFTGAMESYLISLERQEVFIEEIGRSFRFKPWEPIHMEYSYKYLESDIDEIARETGFAVNEHLYDSKRYFIDSMWEVKKVVNGAKKVACEMMDKSNKEKAK